MLTDAGSVHMSVRGVVPQAFPEWGGNCLPGELLLRVEAQPAAVITGLTDFLAEAVAAEPMETLAQDHVKAIVFWDYVPLHIDAQVYQDGGAAAVVFRDMARMDVIGFHKVRELAADFLSSCKGLVVNWQRHQASGSPGKPATASPALLDFEDDDEDFVDIPAATEESCLESVELLLAEALGAQVAATREDAAQTLARLPEKTPGFRVSIARAMVARQDEVFQALQPTGTSRLAVAYPLAAALASAATTTDAAKVLAKSKLMCLQDFRGVKGMPQIVALATSKALTSMAAAVGVKSAMASVSTAYMEETQCSDGLLLASEGPFTTYCQGATGAGVHDEKHFKVRLGNPMKGIAQFSSCAGTVDSFASTMPPPQRVKDLHFMCNRLWDSVPRD